jgi:hypothetical protein
VTRIKDWVRGGGMLLAYGSSALFPARKEVGLSTVKAVGAPDEDENEKKKEKGDSLPATDDRRSLTRGGHQRRPAHSAIFGPPDYGWRAGTSERAG